MGSLTAVKKEKSSSAVCQAGRSYLEQIISSIGGLYGEEAGQAAGTLVTQAVADLTEATQTMNQADEIHLNELADDRDALDIRDETAQAVRTVLMDLRDVGETVYGDQFVNLLGFGGETPTEPAQVLSQANRVLNNLQTATPPAPLRFGITLDLGQFETALSAGIGDLKGALDTVSEDKKEADKTLVSKRKAMSAFDRSFSNTANLVSVLLKLAGENELARRVRPSTRKPGQTIENASETATEPS